jgi:hypothetical protein
VLGALWRVPVAQSADCAEREDQPCSPRTDHAACLLALLHSRHDSHGVSSLPCSPFVYVLLRVRSLLISNFVCSPSFAVDDCWLLSWIAGPSLWPGDRALVQACRAGTPVGAAVPRQPSSDKVCLKASAREAASFATVVALSQNSFF